MTNRIARVVTWNLTGIVCVSVLGLQSAIAQTAAPTANQGSADTLVEIVVTARKRTESIQDVPSSLTAVSAEQLQTSDVQDIRGLQAIVPGISVNAMEPDHSKISVRGISSDAASPTVSFFVDDVAIDSIYIDSLSGQYEPALFDTQRVEVLSGPQGTLYGGSAMGGALKFISNPAALNVNSLVGNAEVSKVTAGGVGYLTSLVANIPIATDTAALRVGVYHRDLPGFIDRIADGVGLTPPNVVQPSFTSFNTDVDRNINSYATTAARIAATIMATPSITISPQFFFQQTSSSDVSLFWPNLPNFEQSNVIRQPDTDRFLLGTLTVTGHWSFGDVTSISSWSEAFDYSVRDLTAFVGGAIPGYASLVSPSYEGYNSHNVSQEIRVVSPDTAGPLNYVAGVYYRDQYLPRYQNVYTLGSGQTEAGLPDDIVFLEHTNNGVRQAAAFGEATYRIGQLELTGGGRYYHVETRFSIADDGIFNGGPTSSNQSTVASGFSPKVALTYKPTATTMLYALADKGFRPGGGNEGLPVTCNQDLANLGLSSAPKAYRSDSLWNYEIGSKNALFGDRLTANASLFYMKWRDIQQILFLPTCGFDVVGNLGAAVSKGGEFDIDALIVPGLTFHTGVVYNDAYVTQTAPGTGAQLGDPIENAPKVTVSTAMDLSIPLGSSSSAQGLAHIDYQFHDSQAQSFNKTYQSTINPITGTPLGGLMTVVDPSYLQRSYSTSSASMGVRDGHWTVRLVVQNLLNAHPLLAMSSNGELANSSYTLLPRTFVIAVHAEY